MWKKVPVEVAGSAPEKALVDFDRGAPAFLEWPSPVEPNAEITIGDARLFAGPSSPCAGLFHVALLSEPVFPKKTDPEAAPEPEPAPVKRRRKK